MKRVLFFILAWCLCLSNTLGQQPYNRPKVGLVLSGGGAKGVAHIGALKVIEEAGIPIDLIVGTSMGSIVGGLYAIGYTPAQLDSIVKAQNWSFILTDQTARQQMTMMEKEESDKYLISLATNTKPKEMLIDGFVKGNNLHTLFNDLTAGYHDSLDFNLLPIPFACVAVDLRYEQEVVFHRGKLQEAMRASMAIPAVFTPVRMDSMVLVDGGLLNNFPVDVARRMGADIVIGVDVRSKADTREHVGSLPDIVLKLTDIAERAKYERNLKDVDLYTQVDVKGYTAASFSANAIDSLIRRGEEAMRRSWDDLDMLRHHLGLPPDFEPMPHGPYTILTDEDPLFIQQIVFEGVPVKNPNVLVKRLGLKEKTFVTMPQLHRAIDELYATQAFTHVDYELLNIGGEYRLVFKLRQDPEEARLRVGIRFDSEKNLEAQLNVMYRFGHTIPSTAKLTGRVGKQSFARLDYQILMGNLRNFNLAYMYQYNDVNYYDRGVRAYNATFNDHFAEFSYTTAPSRNMRMGVGAQFEYYQYRDLLQSHGKDLTPMEAESFFNYFAMLRFNSTDKRAFPTEGTNLFMGFMLVTSDLVSYRSSSPLGIAHLNWEQNIRLGERFTLMPAIYARSIFWNSDTPFPYMTTVGGDAPARYAPYQIPFAGINFVEQVDNTLLVGRLKMQQRMGANHYISLTGNYGMTDRYLMDAFKGKQMIGMSVSYGYNTIIGPVEASFSISNWTKKFRFYLNVGHRF